MADAKRRRLDLNNPVDQAIALQWFEELEDDDLPLSDVSETEDNIELEDISDAEDNMDIQQQVRNILICCCTFILRITLTGRCNLKKVVKMSILLAKAV